MLSPRNIQIKAGGDKKSDDYKKSVTQNFVEASNVNRSENETNAKLAKVAGVGKEIYRMGAKILKDKNCQNDSFETED